MLNQKSQYDQQIVIYKDLFLKFNQESIEAYNRHFKAGLKNKKLIDLGCGNGFDLSQFKKKGAEIYGIDSSYEMVIEAAKTNPSAIIKHASFEYLPFENSYFDYVVSKWAFQTSEDILSIYKEVNRILKPGGKFIFLACHPIRQFLEKKCSKKSYFKKELVESLFFDNQVVAYEYSHTFNEYLGSDFFKYFHLESYEEGFDSAAEQINGDIYPSYFILNSTKKI